MDSQNVGCSVSSEGMVNIVNDDEMDNDDVDDTSMAVDEERLNKDKSPFEQKFIRDHRPLFSETLNPDSYMHCLPMTIKLRENL